ncbi:hypothetical protein INT47_000185 [Mucor saturninus]|uniref:glucan endo-1,3-beta-D-glucosidase n=1 Tax=Mucor saturninus TaxID=64648 RepID=A0A8H7R468_9FUNG|nr:hypothetical protein INT47_000185 [Mucor saturninus]
MRFTSLVTIALSFAGVIQSLPVERRGITSLNGVTYTARNSNGECQSSQEIAASVKLMKSSGVHSIRTYSQECDQLPAILDAIKSQGGGMTVLASVWIDGTSKDQEEISTLKSVLANHDTSAITGILVGNEVLFNGVMPASELIKKFKAVKAISKGIDVGTAEMDVTYPQELVDVSDFVAVNIHPYFSQVDIKNAMSNLNDRYNAFKKMAGGKKTYIAEVGWPSAGASSGKAVPSVSNTETFASEISRTSLPYYFFEWQDSNWKSSGIESNFGLLNSNGKAKFGI